jgi:hypothetical protein
MGNELGFVSIPELKLIAKGGMVRNSMTSAANHGVAMT